MSASLADCREQDVLVLVTKDGQTLRGSYLTQARMHFISIRNPETILLNKVLGPFTDDDVASLEIVKDRDEGSRNVMTASEARWCPAANH